MLRRIQIIIGLLLIGICASAQFPNNDSLRSYIDKYIRNSAIESFTNLRLNTTLKAITRSVDSVAGLITGGVRVVDTLYAPTDSTIAYKIQGHTYIIGVRGSNPVVAGDGLVRTVDTITSRTPVYITAAQIRALASPSTASVYKLSINGTVGDFIYNPSNTTSVDDSLYFIRKSGGGTYERVYDFVDPFLFGVVPGTGADMTAKMQKCANFAINSTKSHEIVFTHNGAYVINDLIIAKYNGSNQAQQVTLTIRALSAADADGVKFITTNGNSAAIHIQTAKGVYIENIVFQGPRSAEVSNYITGDWTQSGAIRSNAYSPNVVFDIDNFFTGASTTMTDTTRYYPNVPKSYYLNTAYAGSSNIAFRRCSYQNYFAIVAQGLSNCPQGENIRIEGGYGNDAKYVWIAGQLQSRENAINNLFFFGCDTYVTNVGFGSGLGDVPAVNNSNLNNAKYLFQVQADFTSARFNGGYSEGIWSLGKSTSSNPVTFNNWHFRSLDNDLIAGGITATSPVWVEAKSLSWNGGRVEGSNYNTSFPMAVLQAEFTGGVAIVGNIPFNTNPDIFDRITFRNAQFTGGHGNSSPSPMSENEVSLAGIADEASYYGRYLLPGSAFRSRTNRTYKNVGQKIDRIAVGAHTITLNTSTRVATFTVSNPGAFLVGDLIVVDETINYTGDVYTAAPTNLGYVTGVSGTTVTVSYVPFGFTTATSYTMYVARIPAVQPHVLGSVTSGNDTVKSVLSEDGSTFSVGSRIKGLGIAPGAYVVAVGSGYIKMSMVATATYANTELYDARIQVNSDNNTFSYFGSPTVIFTLGAVWFKGDEIKNVTGGEPRQWQVTTAGKVGGSPAPVFSNDGVGGENQFKKWVGGVPTWADLYPGIRLTGTPFGSAPLNGEVGFQPDQAFDDSLQSISAFVTNDTAAYVGLTLAKTYVPTKVRAYPVSGNQFPMRLQGSNTSTSTGFEDIYTLPTAPVSDTWTDYSISATKGYKYLRLYQSNPSHAYVEVIEAQFIGYEVNGISLTTTGSGAATLVDGVLNVPVAGTGSGTVTSASSGNLSNLATVAVSTATTTPAFAFTMLQPTAHTFFGNNTGSTTNPAYGTLDTIDIANLGIKMKALMAPVIASQVHDSLGTPILIRNAQTPGGDTTTRLSGNTLIAKTIALGSGTNFTVNKVITDTSISYQGSVTGTVSSGEDVTLITGNYTVSTSNGMIQNIGFSGNTTSRVITLPTTSAADGLVVWIYNYGSVTVSTSVSFYFPDGSSTSSGIAAGKTVKLIKKVGDTKYIVFQMN